MSFICEGNTCSVPAVMTLLVSSIAITGSITDTPSGLGAYLIIATGPAEGGGWFGNSGGRGAVVTGTFTFTAKWTLSLLLGGGGCCFYGGNGTGLATTGSNSGIGSHLAW